MSGYYLGSLTPFPMTERLTDQDIRTDEGLMLAYKAGDAQAFDILYGRWRRPLYRYVAHQCGRDGVSDELFQDVWLRVVNARLEYEPSAKFSTWLFRIAHNRVADHWRASNRKPVVDFSAEEEEDITANLPGPEDDRPDRLHARKALAEHIAAAVQTLPDAQREAFLLAEDGGMSLEAIASLTDVGRETVKSRLRYAFGKLRQELNLWR